VQEGHGQVSPIISREFVGSEISIQGL